MKRIIFIVLLAVVYTLVGCASDIDDSLSEIDDKVDELQLDTTLDTVLDTKKEDEIEYIDEYEHATEVESGLSIQEEDSLHREYSTGMMPVTLYYQDADGYIIPVTRSIPKQEGVAKAAVSGLIDSPLNREELGYYGIYPTLPQGTEVLGMNIKEGVAVIDFTEDMLYCENEIQEKNLVSAIVYTLTEFDSIDGVRIWVNGYEDKELKYGTSLAGVLTRKNIWINSKEARPGDSIRKADIYLIKTVNDNFSYMLPVSIEISFSQEENLPETVIRLLKGNYENNLYSGIPQEANLRGSSLDGDLLTLNFDDGITSYGGGTSREAGIVEQILYSMKQISGVDRVRILINGEIASLPEGSDVSAPMMIPREINNVMQ